MEGANPVRVGPLRRVRRPEWRATGVRAPSRSFGRKINPVFNDDLK